MGYVRVRESLYLVPFILQKKIGLKNAYHDLYKMPWSRSVSILVEKHFSNGVQNCIYGYEGKGATRCRYPSFFSSSCFSLVHIIDRHDHD